MSETKRKNFKSPDGTEKYIALTSGHTWRIYGDWVSVPEWAWSDCYAIGCISEDQIQNTIRDSVDQGVVDTLSRVRDREDRIKNAIRKWYENNEREHFDSTGRPKTISLRDELSLKISVQERNKCWRELQEELK